VKLHDRLWMSGGGRRFSKNATWAGPLLSAPISGAVDPHPLTEAMMARFRRTTRMVRSLLFLIADRPFVR
jgi:hypothetical protein